MKLPPALSRPFRIIAFDWDGTAVASRTEDATRVRERIERLLRAGVLVLVITGTSFTNIDAQLSAKVRGPHKRRLHMATNRGSEVYGFDDHSRPVILEKRVATPEEDRLLTSVAETIRSELAARTGLDFQIIYDRVNRRKIDLIPGEEWRDPPKSAIGALFEAVESRLAGAGLSEGLREVFRLAETVARKLGLANARITSDVKHVEVGLTDKADSIRWLVRELAAATNVHPSDFLIAGDEFGPVAGFPGSDAKMMIPGVAEATYVSVGPEPGGAPEPVIHLGGGPDQFLTVLAQQAQLHAIELPARPSVDGVFHLVEEGFSVVREHEIESLFAVANGYLGSRASLVEGSSLSFPATFVAGVFDVPARAGAVPEFALMPDWSHVGAIANEQPLALETGENPEHRRTLDLRSGIFFREWRHRDPLGRVTRVHGFRLASIADRHTLLQSIILIPENYGGQVIVETSTSRPIVQCTTSGARVAFVASTILEQPEALRVIDSERAGAQSSLRVDLEMGKTYRLDRIVSVFTSREAEDPLESARRHLDEVLITQWSEGIIAAHRREWRRLWETADVRIEGDDEAQRAIRFAIYHLLSAANPEDERVSIGARALTGASYKGHVFWDTEVFLLPFFTLTLPAAARALLMYRFHTLPAARAKAARLGYRGALYAWESADTGDEATPAWGIAPDGRVNRVLNGTLEHHISADIAYSVWQYWQWTYDDGFLQQAGAEILLETARFWASRVQSGADGRFHILSVIGPDEYHESVDDNAYTNGMAQWNLERGAEIAALVEQRWPDVWDELRRRLDLRDDEPREWSRLAANMYTGLVSETGVIEQFRGFSELEAIDLSRVDRRGQNMDVVFGHERIQGSQVIKQADVIMLIHLLWDRFPKEVRLANYRFYEPRTDHGSSLSPPIHALVAARLGNLVHAKQYFRRTAEIDLGNNMGNAAGGVHMGALGGLWQAAVFGFAGLEIGPEGPALKPHLPTEWRRLAFGVQWRSRRFDFQNARPPQPVNGSPKEISR